MKKIVVKAKTIEEAIEQGLQQLGKTKEQVNIEVLEQPSKGLFGLIGSRDASVQLSVIHDPIEIGRSFLKEMCQAMGLEIDIEKIDRAGDILFNISGKELGMLIGRRGQTLDALQYLVNIVANRGADQYIRIILDAENFRERRKKTLQQLSLRLASQVVRTRKEVVLEPMSAHERKIIHSQLQNHDEVKTFSKGENANRRIVITLK